MNVNKIPFVNYTFTDVYIATPWNALFEKKTAFENDKPFYCVHIIVSTANKTLQALQSKLDEYAKAGNFSKIAKPIIHDLDENKVADEMNFLSSQGQDLTKYKLLILKNKSDKPEHMPVLRTPDNRDIARTVQNHKFFKRGTRVNVKTLLGVNIGQPYFMLQGVQYVASGFSDKLADPQPDFDVITDANTPADMQVEQTVYYDASTGLEYTIEDEDEVRAPF